MRNKNKKFEYKKDILYDVDVFAHFKTKFTRIKKMNNFSPRAALLPTLLPVFSRRLCRVLLLSSALSGAILVNSATLTLVQAATLTNPIPNPPPAALTSSQSSQSSQSSDFVPPVPPATPPAEENTPLAPPLPSPSLLAPTPSTPPSSSGENTSALNKSLENIGEETLNRLKTEAKAGNNNSAILVGQYYEDKNLDEAAQWYEVAADNPKTPSLEAVKHLLSIAQKQKNILAMQKWLIKASSLGMADANLPLADILTRNPENTKDTALGISYLQKAVDAKMPQAIQKMASFYLSGSLGSVLPKNVSKAFALDMAAAKEKYPPSILAMYFFIDEPELSQDEKKQAIDFLTNLVEEENPVAEDALGMAMVYGHGVEKNESRGAELVRRAAEAEFVSAEADIGYLFLKGIGVPADAKMANVWYGKAAMRGNIDAVYMLGMNYIDGVGVARNPQHGLALIARAASNGDVKAILTLADFFADGKNGVPQDASKAAKLFEAAANMGSPEAEYRIGKIYESGDGVTKDENKAKTYLAKAAKDGYKPDTAPASTTQTPAPSPPLSALTPTPSVSTSPTPSPTPTPTSPTSNSSAAPAVVGQKSTPGEAH